jgi:hypothetical protein
MSVMTTGQFQNTSVNFYKNLQIIAASVYDMQPKQYPELISVLSTDFATDKMMGYEGSGALGQKDEAGMIETTSIAEGYVDVIRQSTYAFNMKVSAEQQRYSDRSVGFTAQIAKFLTRSANLRYENTAVAPINNATATGVYAGGDGKAYAAADHPFKTGGTYSNLLATADMSQDSLKIGIKATVQAKQERNIPAQLTLKRIVAGTDNVFILPELMKSSLDPETANNTYNVFKDYSVKKVISYYMSDTDAWLIDSQTETRCLKESMKPKMHNFTDGPTQDYVVGIMTMIGSGHYDSLGTFFNAGS